MESKNWELNLDNGQCKREKEELKSKNQELNDNIGQVKKDSEEVNWKNRELSSDLKECGKKVDVLESEKSSLSRDMEILSKHHALNIHVEKVLFFNNGLFLCFCLFKQTLQFLQKNVCEKMSI